MILEKKGIIQCLMLKPPVDSVEQQLTRMTKCFLITDMGCIVKLSLLISPMLHRGRNKISFCPDGRFQPGSRVLSLTFLLRMKVGAGPDLGKAGPWKQGCDLAKSQTKRSSSLARTEAPSLDIWPSDSYSLKINHQKMDTSHFPSARPHIPYLCQFTPSEQHLLNYRPT